MHSLQKPFSEQFKQTFLPQYLQELLEKFFLHMLHGAIFSMLLI